MSVRMCLSSVCWKCVNAKALQGLSAESFKHFLGTTLSFMVKGTQASLGAPISLPDSAALEVTLKKFSETPVHRLYISDSAEHIHGVVSIGDIIPLLSQRFESATSTSSTEVKP
eukprot:TRINITY_DN7532_c0_g1_i1.p1 TRINITY_DN7532_c0_g1~~TRINITY_DN7532_c0_g1_i1.p1  ORF type:complete len:114 (-),score=12.83 TRINITY_DN7532_c0_g1_i1:128-469(-)